MPIYLGNGTYDAAATEGSFNNSISAAGIFDLGVGYQFNNWFRADVTGEYRGGSRLRIAVRDRRSDEYGGTNKQSLAADSYSANLSSIVGLINGYADLGNWYGLTPYVGAGVGFARNTMSGLTDTSVNAPLPGGATSPGRRLRRRPLAVELRLGADGRPVVRRDTKSEARPRISLP